MGLPWGTGSLQPAAIYFMAAGFFLEREGERQPKEVVLLKMNGYDIRNGFGASPLLKKILDFMVTGC